jgi:hypothetical protein
MAGAWVAAGVAAGAHAASNMLNAINTDRTKDKRFIFFILLFGYGIFPSWKPAYPSTDCGLLLDGIRYRLDIGCPLYERLNCH